MSLSASVLVFLKKLRKLNGNDLAIELQHELADFLAGKVPLGNDAIGSEFTIDILELSKGLLDANNFSEARLRGVVKSATIERYYRVIDFLGDEIKKEMRNKHPFHSWVKPPSKKE